LWILSAAKKPDNRCRKTRFRQTQEDLRRCLLIKALYGAVPGVH